jgi:hypothetical protein
VGVPRSGKTRLLGRTRNIIGVLSNEYSPDHRLLINNEYSVDHRLLVNCGYPFLTAFAAIEHNDGWCGDLSCSRITLRPYQRQRRERWIGQRWSRSRARLPTRTGIGLHVLSLHVLGTLICDLSGVDCQMRLLVFMDSSNCCT